MTTPEDTNLPSFLWGRGYDSFRTTCDCEAADCSCSPAGYGPAENCDCSMVENYLWEIMHQELSESFATPLLHHLEHCPYCRVQRQMMLEWVEALQESCRCLAPVELHRSIMIRIQREG